MRKLGLVLLAVLVSMQLAIALNYFALAHEKQTFTMAIKTGTPDEYGNHIRNVTIYQDTADEWERYYNEGGGVWEDRGNLTYLTYDYGDSITCLVNQTVRFDVVVFLNASFSGLSGVSGVEYRTRVLITIAGEITDYPMEYYDVSAEEYGNYDYCK